MAEPHRGVTRLVLIRHGQSRATVDQVAGGASGCRGLSELGVRQAESLRDRLFTSREFPLPVSLLSSTLPRAVETAEIIAPALRCSEVVQDGDLCELDPGQGDGLSWEEWNTQFGSFSFEAEPYRPVAPGGESWAEFQLRVGRTLTRVVAAHAGKVVVVACHGGIVDGSMRRFLGMMGDGPRPVLDTVANTSITEWLCRAETGNGIAWQLLRYNDHAHLGPDAEPHAGH